MLSCGALIVITMVAFVHHVDARWRFSPYVERQEVLWRRGDPGDVAEYRIPIIGPTKDGHLLAVSEARKDSGSDEGNKFLAMRKSNDGIRWYPATKFIFTDLSNVWDGMNLGQMVTDMVTGKIFILYSHCAHVCENSTSYIIHSEDNGMTWKDPKNVTDVMPTLGPVFDPGPGLGLQLKYHSSHKGRLIFCGHGRIGREAVLCIYSDDHGETWKPGMKMNGIPAVGTERQGMFEPNENQMVELPDGTILFTIRNERYYDGHGPIFAKSTDGGMTVAMETVSFPNLPEPDCAAGMLYLDQYHGLLLHSNPFNDVRRNMSVSWSYDEGKTWDNKDNLQVWPGPAAYSCLTAIPGKPDHVGLVYENGDSFECERIMYALINLRPWQED